MPHLPRSVRTALSALAAASVALVMLVLTVPAATADPVVSPTGDYCAANAVTGTIACVDELHDYPAARAAALGTDGAARSVSPTASYLLGRFFDNDQFNTAAGFIDWFGSAPCTSSLTDINSSWSDTTSWRGRISSFQGYSGCRIRAYELAGYGGTSLGWVASSANVGSLNDHIWSVRFS
ncbi:hypothetical protein [Nakamurella leprariae]|uniref:Peptidase inhibitor family I36 protein n=1 Tax=Nakamurella leprariae TaxID=2803911 RepID=A0A938YBP0_9ACTN|nr:hypothetical protein [Nakamurella leprariae]MBM9466641.1 hypothetical protein [Nakamurella leprariae]